MSPRANQSRLGRYVQHLLPLHAEVKGFLYVLLIPLAVVLLAVGVVWVVWQVLLVGVGGVLVVGFWSTVRRVRRT